MTATARPVGPERLRHRPDIEGLRAVAVVLVLLFHAEVPGIEGGFVGVDVFFVLSGFLITRLLLDEYARTGTIHLRDFYARRLRRLLPASTLVLATTVGAAWFVAPPLLFGPIARDALWSAGWVANYRFITQGLDYLAAAGADSPLLHFWSLAVEEQFYLLWPALILLVALLPIGTVRQRAGWLLGVVTLVSLAASVAETAQRPTVAYYALHTRAWELAAGGLLAVGAGTVAKVPPRLALGFGAVGLIGLGVTGATYTTATPFPGWTALLPVVSTLLLLVAGQVAPGRGVTRLLHLRPLQYVGKWSYSLYLWHWPALVLAEHAVHGSLTLVQRLGIVVVSTAMAALTYRWLEDPVRRSTWLARRPRRSLVGGVGLAGVTMALAFALTTLTPAMGGTGTGDAIGDVVEPARLSEHLETAATAQLLPGDLRPPLADAGEALPALYDDGCFLGFDQEVPPACHYGPAASDATRTLVLFGDSHAAHWFPPLHDLAVGRGWRLVTLTKAGCPAMQLPVFRQGVAYEACDQWREHAVERIATLEPDLIVLASSRAYDPYDADGRTLPGGREPFQAAGQRAMIERLQAVAPAADIALIGTTPQPRENAPVCLSANLEQIDRCAGIRDQALAVDLLETQRAVAERSGAIFVDATEWLCHDGRCPAVVGPYLVYSDGSHLSPPFTRWLRPVLEQALLRGSRLPAP